MSLAGNPQLVILEQQEEQAQQRRDADRDINVRIRGYISLPPTDALALLEEQDNTGLMLWQGSARLAEFVASMDVEKLQLTTVQATVIELGCGCGLLGIVAAKAFNPSRLFLTDANLDCCALAQQNLSLNGIAAGEGAVVPLKWGCLSPEDAKKFVLTSPQSSTSASSLIILGGDVIYAMDAIVPLCDTVQMLASVASTTSTVHFLLAFYPRGWTQKVNQKMLAALKDRMLFVESTTPLDEADVDKKTATPAAVIKKRRWKILQEIAVDRGRAGETHGEEGGVILHFVFE